MSLSFDKPWTHECSGAYISQDSLYRYRLWRIWDRRLPLLKWLLLNPSTADAQQDDPTIRRVISLTKRERTFGGIMIFNLFALRSPNPRILLSAFDPSGPENDDVIEDAAREGSIIVGAWGVVSKRLQYRVEEIIQIIGGCDIWAFGVTNGGHPRHPLYLPSEIPIKLWRAGKSSIA